MESAMVLFDAGGDSAPTAPDAPAVVNAGAAVDSGDDADENPAPEPFPALPPLGALPLLALGVGLQAPTSSNRASASDARATRNDTDARALDTNSAVRREVIHAKPRRMLISAAVNALSVAKGSINPAAALWSPAPNGLRLN